MQTENMVLHMEAEAGALLWLLGEPLRLPIAWVEDPEDSMLTMNL
jgi:hypothetical protein